MTDSMLGQAVVYLAAALICVPLAKRLGMGSVLGYLLAGILIGPFCLGFVGQEGQDIMHFAEFGVVMMLFLIGLELEPAHFWRMRSSILGLGSLQLVLTTLALTGGLLLLGLGWRGAFAAGLALSMSSTAIVLHPSRKGARELPSRVQLFRRAAVPGHCRHPDPGPAPLSCPAGRRRRDPRRCSRTAGRPAGLGEGRVSLLCPGRSHNHGTLYRGPLSPHRHQGQRSGAFHRRGVADHCLHCLPDEAGRLEPALGAFLAGVLLANSEFRHELESDIEPFKGLLLGLFFIAVGASINFRLLADSPGTILSLVLAIIVLKAAVLIAAGRLFRLSFDQNSIFALGLSQVGEFAFVLFAFINRLGIIGSDWTDTLMAVTAISMIMTPLLLLMNERLVLPRFGTRQQVEKEADLIDTEYPVIIAGFSSFGSTLGVFLRANGVQATVLDNDSDQVDLLRKMGFKVFYGDATRLDILHSAGARNARILFIAIDSPSTVSNLVKTVKKHFPKLQIMARAGNNLDAQELLDLGVNHIYRGFLDTSVRKAGVHVLASLGHRRFSATRAGRTS